MGDRGPGSGAAALATEGAAGTAARPDSAGGAGRTILQVLPALKTGGVERGAVDVAAAAVAAGFRALVASAGGPMVRELDRAGAEHITLPVDSKNPVTIRRNIDRLESLIRGEGADVVHVRSRAPAWSAWYATRRTGTPLVTTFHGTYNFSTPLKRRYNAIMTRGDRVIAISEFIADHMRRNYRMNTAAIRVIPRGVNLERFDPERVSPERVIRLSERWRLPDGMPVVMLPGRLTRWKGQILLVRALKEIERGPVRCLFVGAVAGRDAYAREIMNTAARLGVADMVHVVGDCDDMPAAYKLADVVVSASTDPEAFGRVAAEGQAMGRPVVAPRHGAAPEQVIEDGTGWLFNPGDPYDLALRIDTALSLDAPARERLYARSIENIRARFDNARMCADTLDVYRELLQAPAPRADAA